MLPSTVVSIATLPGVMPRTSVTPSTTPTVGLPTPRPVKVNGSMTTPVTSLPFNDEPMPGPQYIDDLLGAAGLPPVDKHISLGAARFAAAVIEGLWSALELRREPPLTRFMVSQLSTAHWYDISAARRDLGYAPRVSYAEGMSRLRASLTG